MIYFNSKLKLKGFSLLEMLLVMAVMGSVLVAAIGYTTQRSDEMRRDRAVMQIQQILNAGLAYYVNKSAWPTQLSDLQGSYLPGGTIKNPWGLGYAIGPAGTPVNVSFSVCTTTNGKNAYTSASIVAGRLPMASAIDGPISGSTCPTTTGATPCTINSATCTVVSAVTIPGQNLNNARSINFAGLYHNGACVAAPSCPPNMVPSIVVTPVSVSGATDGGTMASGFPGYPITSFTAYAVGTNAGAVVSPGDAPLDCNRSANVSCGLTSDSKYWRVCIRIFTEKGPVRQVSNNFWARDAGIILALTRCMPEPEPRTPAISGSPFTVFMHD